MTPTEPETLTVHVASETDPALTYTLHARGDVITCNCRGYNTTGHCRHQRALSSVLERKAFDDLAAKVDELAKL